MAYLAGAVALALLLPSGLTLPNDGPSTLAEYAPVPGRGQGVGDVSEFGQASSGGVGGGVGRGGVATTTTVDEGAVAPGGRVVRKPGTKRCVGNPPRQTEDPLSPPCVPFFEGDNGGATSKGVTREEIRVVAQFADFSQRTDPRYGQLVDCAEAPTEDDAMPDLMCKAFTRFFNDRYQTYGRTVRIWNDHNSGRFRSLEPFAHVAEGASVGNSPHTERRMGVGYTGRRRADTQKYAPYMITFRPDVEYRIELFASWICNRLAGRPARYAGDPLFHGRQRRFGIVRAGNEYESGVLKARLKDLCNVSITSQDETDDFGTPTGIARLQANGVTSVVMLVANSGHITASSNASAIGWFPEWLISAPATLNSYDTNFFGRQANQAQWANAFGVTLDIRRDTVLDQPWYKAYREGCPSCRDPQASDTSMVKAVANYDSLAMLFYGIQAGGPRLTPESVDKGLHSIPPRASDDPFRPAAYFSRSVGGYIKDAMEVYWDPSGRAAGSASTGCYRLPKAGKRFRSGEWPAGDGDVKAPGPCQGEAYLG